VARDWVRTGVGWDHVPTGRGSKRVARAGVAEREEALQQAPLFAGLPRRHVRALARVSGVAEYGDGMQVVKEGVAGTVFFVILEGKARVVHNGKTVARLGKGDFFGELSLIDGGPRTADVITEAPSRMLTLSRTEFRKLLASEPALSGRLLETLADRVRNLERPPAG
jgi:CRP/FNR family transcriptional regulator, cyclic AMP receptor protein